VTAPPSRETTLFSDNFDTYPVGSFPSAGGWEVVWGGTGQNLIVSDPCVSKPNAFQLWGKPGVSSVVQRKFSTTAPVIGYEFSIRIEKIGTGSPGREESPAFFNRDVATWGGYYAMVQFCHDTRRIKTVDGTVLGQWAPGVWYRVKVILDRRTNLFSVWIDGRLAAENIYTAGDTYQINALALFSGHPGVKVWYDDVRVFAQTPAHSVSTPNAPSGPSTGKVGEVLQFHISGGECVHGHFVHYRLDWGDGTFSDWLDVGTLILIFYRPTHAWDREGTYQVRVQSRCAVDTSIVSEWSLAKVVTIWVEKEEEFALAGDYGDAPDPGFPTQASSNGPCHLDVSKEWIGPAGRSTTTIDGGPQGTDSDQDDGAPSFWRTGRLTWFSIVVSYDPTKSSAADPRFLNVLLDVDGNGRWEEGDKGEWVVQNLEVDFRRVLPQGATSQRLVVLVNPAINPEALAGCWARITLSNRTVLDGSGAWGVFERGETEDHLLSGPGSPPPCAKKVVELLMEKLLEVGTEETVTYWDGVCDCGFEGKLIGKDGGSPYYWDIPVPPIPWPNTISLRFVSVRQDVLGFDAPPCSRLLDATAGVDPVSHLFRGDWSLKLNAGWTVIANQDRGPLSPFQYGRTHVKAFLKFPSFPGHDVVRVELEARVNCDGEWVVVTQFSDPAPVVRAR